jgi:hypothetical protein
MIGLDTNVLARYDVQDATDAETQHQHESARKLIESGEPRNIEQVPESCARLHRRGTRHARWNPWYQQDHHG